MQQLKTWGGVALAFWFIVASDDVLALGGWVGWVIGLAMMAAGSWLGLVVTDRLRKADGWLTPWQVEAAREARRLLHAKLAEERRPRREAREHAESAQAEVRVRIRERDEARAQLAALRADPFALQRVTRERDLLASALRQIPTDEADRAMRVARAKLG